MHPGIKVFQLNFLIYQRLFKPLANLIIVPSFIPCLHGMVLPAIIIKLVLVFCFYFLDFSAT